MANTKLLTKFCKGFFWIFFAALFLFIDFQINGVNVFHDTIGYVFAIFGILYFISNKEVLDKKYQPLILILVLCLALGLINHIANTYYKAEITNQVFIWLNSWLFPITLLSTSLIGLNVSQKHISSLAKRWKILSGIFGAFLIIYIGLSITPLFINKESNYEFSGSVSGGYVVPFLIFMVLLMIYSFVTIWKTYSLSKKA
jgi:hypothetical protein